MKKMNSSCVMINRHAGTIRHEPCNETLLNQEFNNEKRAHLEEEPEFLSDRLIEHACPNKNHVK